MLCLIILLSSVCGLMLKKKKKAVVFSRGKIRKTPTIKYNGQPLELVFDLQYLGLFFHYDNKFNVAQKRPGPCLVFFKEKKM